MNSVIIKTGLLVILSIASFVVSAAAVRPNPNGVGNIVFQPTDGDITILSVEGIGVDIFTLYMFDDSADISLFDPILNDYTGNDDILSVHPVPTDLNFTGLTISHPATSDTLSLSDNNNFIFALWLPYLAVDNSPTGSWIEATYATQLSPNTDSYSIEFLFDVTEAKMKGSVVLGIDVTPVSEVPLPGAFVLLGSALLGLFGYRKKRLLNA